MSSRRLAAILAIDVVGSSRLVEADEAGALAAIHNALETLAIPIARANGGRLIKITGDGGLVEFGSAVHAVQCAVTLQQRLRANRDAQAQRIQLRWV
jgi:adenylate cyclase